MRREIGTGKGRRVERSSEVVVVVHVVKMKWNCRVVRRGVGSLDYDWLSIEDITAKHMMAENTSITWPGLSERASLLEWCE